MRGVSRHANTVMGYNEKTDSIELQDPWGQAGAPFPDASMKISDLDANFTFTDIA